MYYDPCHDELPNITLLAVLVLLLSSPAQHHKLLWWFAVNRLPTFVATGSDGSQKCIHEVSTSVDRAYFDECLAHKINYGICLDHDAPHNQTYVVLIFVFVFLPCLPMLIILILIVYNVYDVFMLSLPSWPTTTPTTPFIAIAVAFACLSVLVMFGWVRPTYLEGIVCLLAPILGVIRVIRVETSSSIPDATWRIRLVEHRRRRYWSKFQWCRRHGFSAIRSC